MSNLWNAILALSLVLSIAGCGDDDRPRPDGGPDTGMTGDGGGDVCEGRVLCTTAGTSCDGTELVTCATDSDGCLVATRTDCADTGTMCDASGGSASCVDPCADVPEADRCDTDGARTCNGETLEVCAMDAGGCLVLERTACDASPGGVCDDTDMPMCALPPDPCAAIDPADACATEGTSCDGDELVECAPDAFGCLVVTRTDCTSRDGGACDATGAAAICTATDPCAGLTTCSAAGTACDGPELVECEEDAFGCLVESRTDCTGTMFGFCDETATPSAMCSTAAVDPCMGVTECGTATSRSCTDTSTLDVCAPNAFGCFVSTTTDCSATSEVCDDGSGTAMCVDPCSLVTTCPSATYCDGADVVTCAADAAGCLVESSRTTCGTGTACMASGGAASCVDSACPEAGTRVIDCASGTVTGDTSAGTTARSSYDCSTFSYPGQEEIWRFDSGRSGPVEVQIVATRTASSGDFDLYVLDGSDTSLTCSDTSLSCLDSSTGTTDTETVDFLSQPGQTDFVVYDIFSSTTTTSGYSLAVTCTDIVCGDGDVQPGEQCDDGDTDPGDGCSATCTVEGGYTCSGDPSTCVPGAANSTCASATAITADMTITGEDPTIGGPRPTGSGCGTSSGSNALYYAVTIPANSTVDVQTTPSSGFDIVLLTQDSCADTACTFRTDSSPERRTLTNVTGSAVTRIVAVHPYSSGGSGTYDISFTYRGPLAANATCATATAITTDTTITAQDPTLGGPRPTGTGCGTSSGSTALYYAVSIPADTSVDVQTTPSSGFDIVLLTQDSCADTACTFRTDSSPERTTLANTTASSVTRIVAVHPDDSGDSGTFDISFTYRSPLASNASCATATAITSDMTITGEDPTLGGLRPTGTGCGSSSGSTALYYAVSIPAATEVRVQTTPSFDIVLLTQDSCTAASCTFRTDSSPEGTTLTNASTTAMTRIVAVHPYSASGTGTYDIAFTYTAVPYTLESITSACVTTGTWTSLTRSGSGDDETTAITPLPFAFTYFGDAVTHYSTNTNGIAQLWPISSGSPSSAYSNVALPSTSTPNGTIAAFWDDLYLGSAFDIRTQTIGSAGSQVFVIEWNDALAGSGGDPITFQAHLYEGTNVIEVHFCSVGASAQASGDSATIGVENLTGTSAVTASYNTAGGAATGTGYRFTP